MLQGDFDMFSLPEPKRDGFLDNPISEKQTNSENCGPASLAFVLKRLGKEISQKELAKRLHVKEDEGTEDYNLVRVAKEEGFKTQVYEKQGVEETLEKLKGHLAILDYLMGSDIEDDGHFVVYIDSDNKTVTLWNPWNGKYEKRDKKRFGEKWIGLGDDEHKGVYRHWALVIES